MNQSFLLSFKVTSSLESFLNEALKFIHVGAYDLLHITGASPRFNKQDKLELPCELREYESLVINSIEACSSQLKKYFETVGHTLYRITLRNFTFKMTGLHFLRSIQDISFEQQQVQDYKEQKMRPVCFDRTKNMILLCGHAVGQYCFEQIEDCPICRKTGEKRISTFQTFLPPRLVYKF